MVEDRVTDGERIGQLFASELTGGEWGPLGSVAVVDARDAAPSGDGEFAFGIDFDGDRVGRVVMFPASIAVELSGSPVDPAAVRTRASTAGLDVRVTGDTATVRVESGAAVKRAVDAVVAGLDGTE